MLIKEAYPVQKNDIILVHAAAGGVGSLISRWAKVLGATVIGTVGSNSKKEYALAHGIDHVITLDTEDLQESVYSFTKGKGIKAVLDGVGQATFNQSLSLLENGGTALLFGSSSGTPIIDRSLINSKNIKLIQPNLGSYLPDQESVKRSAEDVFDAFRAGILGDINPTIYSLSDAAKAHQDLESGQTKGSILFHINL
jgi:NADPH:quinone reductase